MILEAPAHQNLVDQCARGVSPVMRMPNLLYMLYEITA